LSCRIGKFTQQVGKISDRPWFSADVATGEPYAGYYVPYIADAFINIKDPGYHNHAGISLNDPLIGDLVI
jgi:hypothetical protein